VKEVLARSGKDAAVRRGSSGSISARGQVSVATAKPAYRRVLLKLSGEALMGDQKFGIDEKIPGDIPRRIKRSTS